MFTSSRNTLLRINLSERTATAEDISPGLAAYVGGMGIGVKLLLDEVPAGTDALGAGNKLIFAVGPLTGTHAPMFPQTCIVTKSPLTGTILNAYAGGTLGPEIKQAGYDALVFEGAAAEPVFVFIDGKEVSFHPAADLSGLGASETARQVRRRIALPEARVVSIGLAGENRVRFASALSEHRVFGRGGAGAVMGAKNLKAIAVYGDRPVAVRDADAFDAAVEAALASIQAELENEFSLLGMFSRYGTGAGMGLVNERRMLATRNHRFGHFDQAHEIDAAAFEKTYPTRPVSCFGCPVHCGMLRRATDGPLKGLFSRGPEYETMYALGSNLALSNREALFQANDLCDQYGMDTLTTGAVLGLTLEAAEKGLVKDGQDLRFGDPASILGLIEKIAHRDGLGHILAEGPARAAVEIGGDALDFAMQIKNSGYAAWMPRPMKGTGLSFATANRGACHKRAPIGAEIMGFVDGASTENKAAMVKEIQDKVNAYFTLVSCRFAEFVLPPEICVQLLAGATGLALSEAEFMQLGERIWNLERIFNVAEGFSRKDDQFPAREFEPVAGEDADAPQLTRAEADSMLDEYYALRGWDNEGVPTAARLAELGLSDYAQRLETPPAEA
ncbi:MAG: aldehyde ferredoxin oxidoreductase family protein [Anaerolineae bacterium]